ncbi:mediator of RNA polymerase II transcription subunit 16-like [Dorcoceras hygrometricum]|uniref:Mediator of RNA polymerase II transcription subunit 16-like n=1 Tax=Dorcoceras hygrometricum TaxID=472368 RepID=A0A2Z7CB03_9LAMI|nr:mediator of RNA polymerase II transcription subunit 16-like [Dorcoceras hygrometricum]
MRARSRIIAQPSTATIARRRAPSCVHVGAAACGEPGASRLIAVDSSIRSTTGLEAPSSDCTRSPDEISTIGFFTSNWPEQISGEVAAAAAAAREERREAAHAFV